MRRVNSLLAALMASLTLSDTARKIQDYIFYLDNGGISGSGY